MRVGIVGHEAAKFTPETEATAKALMMLMVSIGDTVVSGACHLGGIDIWAEEMADAVGLEKLIFPPKTLNWSDGYKPRNLLIAQNSDIVHCLVVKRYPPGYSGMRFPLCYHCKTADHVKSGGCWTAKKAKEMGKGMMIHEIE